MNQFATYSPEDDKLRLYVGRVPRDEYERLRSQGWTSTPKQDCDFVAVWTPRREATAREYSEGVILDEDQGPAERAADRAERFAEYREKRTAEAIGHADTYDAQPSAYGFQSQARANRAAARHDRSAGYACDAWSKAEYWQRRTAGVISHALHLSTPAVRMGRILTLEAEQRKHRASSDAYAKEFAVWKRISEIADGDKQTSVARNYSGSVSGASYSYQHPRPELCSDYVREHGTSLYSLLSDEKAPVTGAEACALYFAKHLDPESAEWQDTSWVQWERHYVLRLAYENQMLEAQGGRAAFVEMEAGGWLAGRQIHKVNKSPATGRVVSVLVQDKHPSRVNHYGTPYPDGVTKILSHTINVERAPADAYRPPTDEERAAFLSDKKARKAAAPKADPCPIINPTEEEAEKLQALWNAEALARHCAAFLRHHGKEYADQFKPATITRIPQAVYSANSSGSYARAETRGLCRAGELEDRRSNMYCRQEKERAEKLGPALCKVRVTHGGDGQYTPRSLIILTDKPQKPLPGAVWPVPAPEPEPEPELATAGVPLAQAHFGF